MPQQQPGSYPGREYDDDEINVSFSGGELDSVFWKKKVFYFVA